jgi:NAD(P)-dependent dehydrogenase (short-subunit alcohol dehydrogenase family)
MLTPTPESVPDLVQRVAGRLEGEVAIVTGSTGGLGRAIAHVFALAGARVVVTGRTAAKGAEVLEAVRATGGTAAFFAADITDEAARAGLVRAARDEFGPATILVNNASGRRDTAVHLHATVVDVPADEWDHLLSSDLGSAAAMCRLTIPGMLEAGHGAIVNVSSSTVERTAPMTSAYTAAKAGLNALGRSVTAEFAAQGIRCNAVQPGFIVPDAAETRPLPPNTADRYLTRLTTGVDVALAALFLVSWESETISGIVLPVDAGHTVVRAMALG